MSQPNSSNQDRPQGGGGGMFSSMPDSKNFIIHSNFLGWFLPNSNLSIEADIGIFILYWVLFFYGFFLSLSIYQYTYKRTPGSKGRLAFMWMCFGIGYAIYSLVFKGNIYVPVYLNIISWLVFTMLFSVIEERPKHPKFPSRTIDGNVCMDANSYEQFNGPFGPFGYPHPLINDGNKEVFNHKKIRVIYQFVNGLGLSMTQLFGKPLAKAFKVFKESDAGYSCPKSQGTECTEINQLLQSMMKSYAPNTNIVKPDQINLAELKIPPSAIPPAVQKEIDPDLRTVDENDKYNSQTQDANNINRENMETSDGMPRGHSPGDIQQQDSLETQQQYEQQQTGQQPGQSQPQQYPQQSQQQQSQPQQYSQQYPQQSPQQYTDDADALVNYLMEKR